MYRHSPVRMCKCVFRLACSVNYLLQTSHTHTHTKAHQYETMMPSQILLDSERLITHITGVWICSTMYVMMSAQTTLYLYVLLRTSQVYRRSPRCTSWCMFRVVQSVNDLLHISQVYGCSPLCMLWCTFRWRSTLNDLRRTSQAYGHSPLCLLWCTRDLQKVSALIFF